MTNLYSKNNKILWVENNLVKQHLDKLVGIFIHGHVVYLSVCINGLCSLKTNKGYWIASKEKDQQIKHLQFFLYTNVYHYITL